MKINSTQEDPEVGCSALLGLGDLALDAAIGISGASLRVGPYLPPKKSLPLRLFQSPSRTMRGRGIWEGLRFRYHEVTHLRRCMFRPVDSANQPILEAIVTLIDPHSAFVMPIPNFDPKGFLQVLAHSLVRICNPGAEDMRKRMLAQSISKSPNLVKYFREKLGRRCMEESSVNIECRVDLQCSPNDSAHPPKP